MKQKLNIAVIGKGFMGKLHSHMWRTVDKIFDVDFEPVLKVAVGTDEAATKAFAERWGFESYTTDWKAAIERDDVDVIDIVTPTYLHKDMVLYAAQHKKHIFCEKPFSLTVADAEEMAAACDAAGVLHYLNHNYRRVPAVTYAKQLIDEGKIGEVYHFRGAYLQDWIMDENFPLTWHLRKETAGGGPLYDLASHSIDLARYLIGEVESVYADMRTFISDRPLPGAGSATFSKGTGETAAMGKVTVDDAAFIVMDFVGKRAIGSCDVSRFAGGRRNYNYFEIYGSKGSLTWNLERMDELNYLSNSDAEAEQGFRNIMATYGSHPYTGSWWAPGHIVGYETTFVNAAYDYLTALSKGEQITPNFHDGVNIIKILDACKKSAATGAKVKV